MTIGNGLTIAFDGINPLLRQGMAGPDENTSQHDLCRRLEDQRDAMRQIAESFLSVKRTSSQPPPRGQYPPKQSFNDARRPQRPANYGGNRNYAPNRPFFYGPPGQYYAGGGYGGYANGQVGRNTYQPPQNLNVNAPPPPIPLPLARQLL